MRAHLLEEVERFGLVLLQRIALAVAAQADDLAQMVEHDQMLAPEMVERLQQNGLLDVTHHVGAPLPDLGRHVLVGPGLDAREQLLVGDALFLGPVLDRQVEIEHALELFLQARDVPLLGIGMLGTCLATRSSMKAWRMSATVSATLSSFMRSTRWSKITLRWSFWTLSNLSKFLRMSKLRASTFCCAFSSALLIQGWMMASPSCRPRRCSMLSRRSEPKMRIRSSSSDRKNFERPGSP